MNRLERWMQRETMREENRSSIEDSMLRRRFSTYAFKRLGLPFLRFGLNFSTHILELIVLTGIFYKGRLSAALVLAAVCSLFGAGWWGALEIFREELRELYREKKSRQVNTLLNRWVKLGPLFAFYFSIALALLAMLLFSMLGDSRNALFHASIAGAYIVRAGVSTVVQTLHSAVFAVRRVYRPMFIVFGIDVLTFGIMLLGRQQLGPWSFPLFHLVATFLQAGVTVHYLKRMFFLLNWQWPQLKLDLRHPIESIARTDVAMAALSSIMLGLDAIIVLFLYVAGGGHALNHRLLIFLCLIAPALRMSHDWVRVFYVDFNHADLVLFKNLRSYFERNLRVLSLGVGTLCWLSALAALIACFGSVHPRTVELLFVIFLCRSALGYAQFRQFTAGDYATVVYSGVVVLVGAAVMGLPGLRINDSLTILSFFLGAALLLTHVLAYFRSDELPKRRAIAPFQWIEILAGLKEPVSIWLVEFNPDLALAQFQKSADRLAELSGGRRETTTVLDRYALLIDRPERGEPLQRETMLANFPFTFRALSSLGTADSGASAVRLLLESKIFESETSDAQPTDAGSLEKKFYDLMGKEASLITAESSEASPAGLSPAKLREIYQGAKFFTRYLTYPKEARSLFVSVLCDRDGMESVYFASGSGKKSELRAQRWAKILRRETVLRAASNPVVP